jgi:hypothetical protein
VHLCSALSMQLFFATWALQATRSKWIRGTWPKWSWVIMCTQILLIDFILNFYVPDIQISFAVQTGQQNSFSWILFLQHTSTS